SDLATTMTRVTECCGAMLFRRMARMEESSLGDRHGNFAWYELLTTDTAAARTFYGHIVGWGAQDASTSAFSYTVLAAGTTEVGGLMELPLDARRMGATPRWIGYVAVDDIDATVDR